jgi:hypothetical protein
MREIGLRGDSVTLLVAGGIGIVQFIAVLPAIVYIDLLGRKPLLRGMNRSFSKCPVDINSFTHQAAVQSCASHTSRSLY